MLTAFYAILHEKQEQLVRLKTCKANLESVQDEFFYNEKICSYPELSPYSWHGTLAAKFEDIRLGGFLTSYIDLENRQLNEVISLVDNKISEIELEIEALKQRIGYLEEQARREKEKQTK
ncbi:YwqH-like family protein [Peribacillus cavernae]|uniref:YwqH-like family protein n=1 Tax=Peribacillus cavernae TaxID=1674310 RepID=UPI00163C541C|nr:DUF5082 family protein [Peribacillus cavernae]MDQ0219755.1 NifB/MoaA-like Fe-S oxidoreductase [Peribacillus cavernae]